MTEPRNETDNLKEYQKTCDESCLRILKAAFEESRRRQQYYVCVDHILKALANDEPYLFSAALSDLGYDASIVAASVERRLDHGLTVEGSQIKLGPDVTDLLKRSMERALCAKRQKIEAADLLNVISEMGLFLLYSSVETSGHPSDPSPKVAPRHAAPPSRIRFRGYLVCLALLGVLFMSQCGAARWLGYKFRKINSAVLNPSFSQPRTKMQSFDPWFDASQQLAEEHNFKFSGRSSSNTVLSLRQKDFRARELLASRNYPSLFYFLEQLQFEGRFDDEYSTLSTWLKGSAFDHPVRWSSQRFYLDYIETFYVQPARGCFENGQFARAKWLTGEAVKRISLIDTKSSPDEIVREKVNIALLYEALFWRPAFVYGHVTSVKTLDEILHRNFDKTVRDKLANLQDGDETELFADYWRGVYDFRDGNFGKAQQEFKNGSVVTTNPKLKELSLLMQARCIFWAQRALLRVQASGPTRTSIIANANTAIGELKTIKSSLTNPSYGDDIARYVGELERLSS